MPGIEYLCGEPLEPRVDKVEARGNKELLLWFDDGTTRVFDAKPLLEYDRFKVLSEDDRFGDVRAAFGTVVWPGGLDYCPDALYRESRPHEADN
jgi:hypothetical protein